MSDSIQNISNNKLQRGEQLGQGSFGIVYKGTWQGHQVAIKVLHASKLPQKLEEQFQREAEIMAKLLNPAIIRLYGICQENNTYAMVMELMPKGDLYAFLNNQKQNIPWNPLRWQLAIDIASGLKYLHENKIFHRDLKSPNILLDHNLKAKITDFGLSRVKLHTSTLHTQSKGGSYPWMAPELFDDKTDTKVTDKIDIYAYGMILWEIAARKHPFANLPNRYVIPIKVMQGKREEIPEDCPTPFAAIITQCWDANPGNRPTASQALKRLALGKQQQRVSDQPRPLTDSGNQGLSNSVDTMQTLSKPLKVQNNTPSSQQDYQSAVQFYREKQYTSALTPLKRAAEANYAPALHLLGVFYDRGLGVSRNAEEAVSFYHKSANLNYAPAQNDMGVWHYKKDEEKNAYDFLARAAKQHLPIALYNLGVYSAGRKQDKIAFSYFHQAHKKANTPGTFAVAVYYDYGRGVQKNKNQAIQIGRMAAKKGYKPACSFMRQRGYMPKLPGPGGVNISEDQVEMEKSWVEDTLEPQVVYKKPIRSTPTSTSYSTPTEHSPESLGMMARKILRDW